MILLLTFIATQMEKGDPEMKLLLGAKAPSKTLIELGGVGADGWKKQANNRL